MTQGMPPRLRAGYFLLAEYLQPQRLENYRHHVPSWQSIIPIVDIFPRWKNIDTMFLGGITLSEVKLVWT